MKTIVAKWKQNARIKTKPDVAMKALEAIREEKGEGFRPADVVEAARAKRHPFHKEFEWNDAVAAQAHRLERAKYIIRSLEITVSSARKGRPESTVTLRKYTSLGTGVEDGKDSSYRETQEVLSDAELRKQVLLKIWRQLLNLKRQYEDYQEFTAVWAAVDAAQEKMVKLG